MLSNVIRWFRSRFHLLWFSYLTRDMQLRSLVGKLRSEGFDFAQFEEALQHKPCRWTLFFQALIHRSYLQFIDEQWDSNERLEFLGDAILNSIVAEHLFKAFPELEEGDLTKLRARLVNRKILAQRSRDMHLSDFLLLSSSAAQSIDSGSESIIADAFEAIIGALYLDGGLAAARKFVYKSLLNNPDVSNFALTDDNYKSALLEYTQARSLGVPRYAVTREEGPEHDRRFTVEVFIGTQSWGSGTGRSKKEAEQSAAAYALENIPKLNKNSQSEDEYAPSAK